MTARDAALWMVGQMKQNGGTLSQHNVVRHLKETSGTEHVYMGENGAFYIDRNVLQFFEKLTEGNVVWDLSGQYWRTRRPGDKPGRTQ